MGKESAITAAIETGTERPTNRAGFSEALEQLTPATEDWLKTARNLVKYAGTDNACKDVEKYLKQIKRY